MAEVFVNGYGALPQVPADANVVPAGDVEDITAILAERPRSVLVAPPNHVTTAELVRISAAAVDHDVPLGYLYTWGGEDPLEHALSSLLLTPGSPDRTLIWTATASAVEGLDLGANVVVATSTGSPLETYGNDTYRLAAFLSHGDGANARFGEAFVCGRRLVLETGAGEDFLPCTSTTCLHSTRNADGTWTEPALLAPEVIRAEFLLWMTCEAQSGSDGPLGRMGLLGQQIMVRRSVRQILSPIGPVDADPALLLFGVAMLKQGNSAGNVGLYLNTVTGRNSGVRADAPWVLLGDPDTVVFPRASPAVPIVIGRDEIKASPGLTAIATTERKRSAYHADDEVVLELSRFGQVGYVANTTASVRSVRVERAVESEAMRALARQMPEIHFAEAYFRAATTFRGVAQTTYDDEAERQLARLHTTVVNRTVHSALGGAGRVDTVERREATATRQANEAHALMHRVLATITLKVGSVPVFSYGRESVRDGVESGRCRYCGSTTVEGLWSHVPTGILRREVRCVRCGCVCDGPGENPRWWLLGDGRAKLGEELRFDLSPDRSPEFHTGSVTLGLEAIPGVEVLSRTQPLQAGVQEVDVDLPTNVPTGAWTAVAAITCDAAFTVIRRKIVLTR